MGPAGDMEQNRPGRPAAIAQINRPQGDVNGPCHHRDGGLPRALQWRVTGLDCNASQGCAHQGLPA